MKALLDALTIRGLTCLILSPMWVWYVALASSLTLLATCFVALCCGVRGLNVWGSLAAAVPVASWSGWVIFLAFRRWR